MVRIWKDPVVGMKVLEVLRGTKPVQDGFSMKWFFKQAAGTAIGAVEGLCVGGEEVGKYLVGLSNCVRDP